MGERAGGEPGVQGQRGRGNTHLVENKEIRAKSVVSHMLACLLASFTFFHFISHKFHVSSSSSSSSIFSSKKKYHVE